MSKQVSDRIVEAFIAFTNASWMQTVVEGRAAEPKTDHSTEVIAGFAVAVDKGRMDADSANTYASQVRGIYMVPTSTFLDMVGQTGGAINATMRLVAAWKRENGLAGKGGRKTGQGKGKTTAPKNDDAEAAAPTVPNDDRSWLAAIIDMRSKVNGRKDWPSDRIAAFQDTAARLIALLKSVK